MQKRNYDANFQFHFSDNWNPQANRNASPKTRATVKKLWRCTGHLKSPARKINFTRTDNRECLARENRQTKFHSHEDEGGIIRNGQSICRNSITVNIRLEGALGIQAEIIRLVGRQLGQLYSQMRQMKPSNLFVQLETKKCNKIQKIFLWKLFCQKHFQERRGQKFRFFCKRKLTRFGRMWIPIGYWPGLVQSSICARTWLVNEVLMTKLGCPVAQPRLHSRPSASKITWRPLFKV